MALGFIEHPELTDDWGYSLDETIERVENKEYIHHQGLFNMSEIAYEYVQSIGSIKDAVLHWEYYIDYEAIVRDLGFDGFWSELETEAEQEAELHDEEYVERFPTYESQEQFIEELVDNGA